LSALHLFVKQTELYHLTFVTCNWFAKVGDKHQSINQCNWCVSW